MMTTAELARRTGVPVSTLKLWVTQGHLQPALQCYGAGLRHEFHETAVVQVQAIRRIREAFGDGSVARGLLEQVPAAVKARTQIVRVPEFEFTIA